MSAFRKKPVVIEAVQWDGRFDTKLPEGLCGNFKCGTGFAHVHTLEGLMRADVGDWIIRGIKGEFYPCKPDIFEATYDPVESDPSPAPSRSEA